jgi:diguanylate cyclase (GGDEF)-like protein
VWHANRLAEGEYDLRLDLQMGTLSESYNQMTGSLLGALKSLGDSEANLLCAIKDLHMREERLQLAIFCTQDGVWDVDLITRRAFFSPRFWEIIRQPIVREDIDFDPVTWGGYIHPDDLAKWTEVISSAGSKMATDYGKHYMEFRVMGGDGIYRWVGMHHMVIFDPDGAPCRFVGTCEDIQEFREREDEIRKQATLDHLTKLPNRYLYNDRFLQKMVMAKRNASSLILIVWDLDGFKQVNDTYGHLAGDRLLVAVSQIMRCSLRETDTLARFGGDEFVMLLSSPPGHEEEVVNLMTSRIFETLKEPVDIGSGKVTIGASCGVSFFPKHAMDGETLFNFADSALYEAKKIGKNRSIVWNPDIPAQRPAEN